MNILIVDNGVVAPVLSEKECWCEKMIAGYENEPFLKAGMEGF